MRDADDLAVGLDEVAHSRRLAEELRVEHEAMPRVARLQQSRRAGEHGRLDDHGLRAADPRDGIEQEAVVEADSGRVRRRHADEHRLRFVERRDVVVALRRIVEPNVGALLPQERGERAADDARPHDPDHVVTLHPQSFRLQAVR